MDRTLLAWNLPNWITVVLMAAVGLAVFYTLSGFILNQLGNGGPSSPYQMAS